MDEKIDPRTDEIVDLAMQDTVPLRAIADQFGLTVDEVVAVMRKNLAPNSYKRWKERRNFPAFRKQSREKPTKHRVHAT